MRVRFLSLAAAAALRFAAALLAMDLFDFLPVMAESCFEIVFPCALESRFCAAPRCEADGLAKLLYCPLSELGERLFRDGISTGPLGSRSTNEATF